MKYLKKIAATIAALAAFGTAQAVPVITPLGSIGLSGSAPLSVALPWSGPFSNSFNFSLAEGNGLHIGLVTSFWGDTPADAPELSFKLTGGPGAGVFAPDINAAGPIFTAGDILTGLEVGHDYRLWISGSNAANLGTSYSLQVAALSVPEPESIALLLLGLGLMSVTARRRQQFQGR